MPTYEITSPDGRKFRVTAPDGASRDEVLAYAKANMPVAQKPEQQSDVTDQIGPFQAGAIAAGRTVDQLAAGLRQMAPDAIRGPIDKLGQMLGMGEPPSIDPKQQEADTAAFNKLADKRPVSTLVGGAAPLVAMPALGSGALGMAAAASLPGLVEYGTPEEKLLRGGLGAAGGLAGAAAGKLLSRAIKPNALPVTQSRQAATEAAERLGVPLRASEKTGSRAMGWAEGALNDLPFSGGMAQKQEAVRRAAMNSAAARAIGQNADELTPDVLAVARKTISDSYDNIIGNRAIPLDAQFKAEVRAITGSKVMKALRDESVDDLIEPFKNLPAGNIRVSGEWFQQNKTALDTAIRTAYAGQQVGKAKALERFERALERAAERSMSQAEREAFKTTQKQWASLRTLEKGTVVEGGNVQPGRLNAALRERYKEAFKEGKIKGDLADIAKIGEVFKPLPQSGTTPRAFYSGLSGGAMMVNPALTAGMLAGPPALQQAMMSKAGQSYLTKGLLQITPEVERMLMLMGAGGASGGLLASQ